MASIGILKQNPISQSPKIRIGQLSTVHQVKRWAIWKVGGREQYGAVGIMHEECMQKTSHGAPVTPESILITLTRALGLKRRIEVWGQRVWTVKPSVCGPDWLVSQFWSCKVVWKQFMAWGDKQALVRWWPWSRTALELPSSGKCSV